MIAQNEINMQINLNVSGIKSDVALKQRYDRFPSGRDTSIELLLFTMPGKFQDILL